MLAISWKTEALSGYPGFGESRGHWGLENPMGRGDMKGMIYEPCCPGSYFCMLKS